MKLVINESVIKAAAQEYSGQWQYLIEADEYDQPFRYVLCAAIVDWVEGGVEPESDALYMQRLALVTELFPNFYY